MFVNRCLLSDAYNHSKQSLDFMQETTKMNTVKERICINFERVAYGQAVCIQETNKSKSYAEIISLSFNNASAHIFPLSHLLAVSRK